MNEWLIIGLGNPGKEYAMTRHNAGRSVLDTLRSENNFSAWTKNGLCEALESRGQVHGVAVRLFAPETYMNESGRSLVPFVKNGLDVNHLIVVHDDIDIPLGQIKVSFDSGAGGHHGVESIIAHTGTQAFHRVRVGIAPKNETGEAIKPIMPVADFVIGVFTPDERREFDAVVSKAITALELLMGEVHG